MFKWFCLVRFKEAWIPWHYIRLVNRWGKPPYWYVCDYCPYHWTSDNKTTKYQRPHKGV